MIDKVTVDQRVVYFPELPSTELHYSGRCFIEQIRISMYSSLFILIDIYSNCLVTFMRYNSL